MGGGGRRLFGTCLQFVEVALCLVAACLAFDSAGHNTQLRLPARVVAALLLAVTLLSGYQLWHKLAEGGAAAEIAPLTETVDVVVIALVVAGLVALRRLAVREQARRLEHADLVSRVSEARDTLRAVIDAAPVAVTLIDLQGNIKLWNAEAERLFGWSAEEIMGRPIPIIPPGHMEEHEGFRRGVRRGAPVVGRVVSRMQKDGSTVEVRLYTAAVRDVEGRVSGLLGILADISKERRLEEQLRQAAKMEAVGQLAGGVAHDFNNLLTAIVGHAELLLAGRQDKASIQRHGGHVITAAERAAALTQQLLAFARRQVLEPRRLDLDAVVDETVPMLRRLIDANISLQVRGTAGLGTIIADPVQIQQVLINLAVNARDAMPRGGALVIETANVDLDQAHAQAHDSGGMGRHIRLTVRDNGSGIDEGIRSQVFEPFFTTKPAGAGTGLGLATVYGVVSQSGGHIGLDSEIGRGTAFHVYFPAVEGAAEPVIQAATRAVYETEMGSQVLVVEDEPSVRELVCETLREAGHRVLEAKSAEQALSMLEGVERPPDLLFSDIRLPEMSGTDLALQLRRRWPAMPVLLTSGYVDREDTWFGQGETRLPLLRKPFQPAALRARIAELLGTPPASNTDQAPGRSA